MYTADSVEKKDNKTKIIAVIVIVIFLIAIFFLVKNYWGKNEVVVEEKTAEEVREEVINSLTPQEEIKPLTEEEKINRDKVLDLLTPKN